MFITSAASVDAVMTWRKGREQSPDASDGLSLPDWVAAVVVDSEDSGNG
jgi:hypothetical protein